MALESVLEAARGGGLLTPGTGVLVMLSGGRDSVCLIDVMVTLCGAERVNALHVNYGLRDAAPIDEQHCRGLCERLGVPLEVLDARRPAEQAGNLQAWAREVRYSAAERLAATLGEQTLIATGHTASDQVETILYRLAASPGRRALLGMLPRDGRLIRPLLTVTREQTGAYCLARGLEWREDESNENDVFARARVRRRLVRELRTIHPAAEANVLRTAELLREEAEVLDLMVAAELHGSSSISIARLGELPAPIARLIVIKLAEQAAGTFVPQAGTRVEEILELASRGGRMELHVGGSVGAVIEHGSLRMVKLEPRG
jgi:tRNA(Ile)-lysidine synthase